MLTKIKTSELQLALQPQWRRRSATSVRLDLRPALAFPSRIRGSGVDDDDDSDDDVAGRRGALALLDVGDKGADKKSDSDSSSDDTQSDEEDTKGGFRAGLHLSRLDSNGKQAALLLPKAAHESHMTSLLTWLLTAREF